MGRSAVQFAELVLDEEDSAVGAAEHQVHTIAHAVARGATRIAPTRFAPTAAVSFSPDDGPKVVGKQLIAAIAPLGKLQISCFSPVDRFELSSSIAVSYPAGRARTKRST